MIKTATKLLAGGIAIIFLSTASAVGVYRYAPLSFLEGSPAPTFGTTAITTINGSDQISASRTTINNNFSSLNSNKVEISDLAATTSLKNLLIPATNISGTLAIANGGTASTTISTNQVIIGNGTSGFNEVSGFGNSGQFLTSGGASVAPSWTTGSLDTTISYNWTGVYFGAKNFYASSTAANPFYLNGLAFSTLSTRAASSTVLSEDGNGHLTFEYPQSRVLYDAAPGTVLGGPSATSTLVTVVIPANTLASNKSLRIIGSWQTPDQGGGSCYGDIEYGNGSSTSTLAFTPAIASNANFDSAGTLTANMHATSTGEYTDSVGFAGQGQTTVNNFWISRSTAVSVAATSYIGFAARTVVAGVGCAFVGGTVELLSQ